LRFNFDAARLLLVVLLREQIKGVRLAYLAIFAFSINNSFSLTVTWYLCSGVGILNESIAALQLLHRGFFIRKRN
jgi:hypothetical protein